MNDFEMGSLATMQSSSNGAGPRGSILTPYLAAWILLAVVAGSYIAIASIRPELLTTSLGSTPSLPPAETNEGQRADTLAANDPLKMQREMLALKQRLAQAEAEARVRAEQERKYRERLAALEEAPAAENATSEPKASASDETAAGHDQLAKAKVLNAPDKAEPSAKGDTKTTEIAKAEPTAASAANTTTIDKTTKQAAPKPSTIPAPAKRPPLETASVERLDSAPIDFGPAVVTPAARPIGVRIATGPSVDSLRLSWSALADRHGNALRSLTPRYMTGIGATGLTYDLVAGPLDTEDEANALCQRLASSGVRCSIGEYTGNAL